MKFLMHKVINIRDYNDLLECLRYGSVEELKALVKSFHEVGIKVLGDVVLNHRCAHYQNHNDIWNIFGGRLNWDDRAIVADDPHFKVTGYPFMCDILCQNVNGTSYLFIALKFERRSRSKFTFIN